MFGKPQKTKKENQRASEELALVERAVLLVLAVVLALVSAISSALGAHWTVSVGSGVAAAISALGAHSRR
jgi:hypothetical protein